MRRVTVVFVLLMVVVSVAASASVESEVKARGEEFAAAWNRHDAKTMARLWAPEGDLINPFGRFAKGRGPIEKLFQDDQSGPMKTSHYRNVASSVRTLTPDLAIADFDVEITGMKAPDNTALPTLKPHVTSLFKKESGKWWILTARAFNYTPAPAPPAKGKK
jgi:uncharacterized protein (TIGR02246 family)